MPGKRSKSRSSGSRTSSRSSGSGSSSRAMGAPGSRIDKMERYEDTLESGGVDDFMFKRDQIMFNPQDESDDDDINADVGEEVLALPSSKTGRNGYADHDENEDEEGEWEDDEDKDSLLPVTEQRKQKPKADLSTKGRFGKVAIDSDEEEEDEEKDEDDSEEEERWGRQYYSRPSTRREKEMEGEYDEKREEERELEVKEVQRLQKRAREGLDANDYGVVDIDQSVLETALEESTPPPRPAAPETTDPATLIRHMESHDPVRLALARDLPLVIYRLKKTAKGIAKMSEEKEGEESLHKGLGWLHYQTLLTYATTLAFYVHLAALPTSSRPDLSTHPITQRLLHLKQSVTALEDLDFAAGSVSDKGPELFDRSGVLGDDDEEEDDLQALMQAKRELLALTNQASGLGLPNEENEDLEEDEEDENHGDVDESWKDGALEDDELAGLLADPDDDDIATYLRSRSAEIKENRKCEAKSQKGKDEGKKKKPKKSEAIKDEEITTSSTKFTALPEPTFVSNKSKKSKLSIRPQIVQDEHDDLLGDPTALAEADASDKDQRKRSLQFHTSKIAATSARRVAARDRRMGGDDDVPRRDRQAARDAALRRNSATAAGKGEDLDGSEWTEKDKKRAREVNGGDEDGFGDSDDVDGGDDNGYYELVKRRKTDKQAARADAHAARQAEKFASFKDETTDGPRALTRAIEKNRGLTPKRSKAGRNPRVKKRQAYEKAKQKVGSQRAVFKGGQATLGGSYSGEKTGISLVVKSRKF